MLRCFGLLLLYGVLAAFDCGDALAVAGGKAVSIRSAPWAVAIVDRGPANRERCSGSIVDSMHILTAAHCLYRKDGTWVGPEQLIVKAGISNYSSSAPGDREQDRYAGAVRIHPGYTKRSVGRGPAAPDDIALLQLTAPLDLSGPTARPIPLQLAPTTPPTGVAAVLAGFGWESQDTEPTGALNEMSAKVDAQGECGFPDLLGQPSLLVFNGVIRCAASPTSSVCFGDSGAGLVTSGPRPRLLAVATGTSTGCIAGAHGIFTYLGAPEISAFIRGSDHPPLAPRIQLDEQTKTGPLHVGESMTCTAQHVGKGTRVRYTFTTNSGRILQSGSRHTYVFGPRAVGHYITCQVLASNAGGTELFEARAGPVTQKK